VCILLRVTKYQPVRWMEGESMCKHAVQWFLCVLVLCVAAAARPDAPPSYPYARESANPTALDRYVAKPDSNYAWELVQTEQEEGLTSYTIDLTSQQWRTAAEVDRPVWKHWLTVTVPETVAYPTALLFVDGGSNRPGAPPRGPDSDVKKIARATRTITASIFMVPNQPLVFADAMGWPRSEDGMIAYTWDKYLRTGDEEWPARLPMTKAAVRAMDTVQAFCASEAGGGHAVRDFVVAGGSKRGWTTWTTAIVDNRVRAIIPCVIDLLNVVESFHHHCAVYGHWSVAVGDYAALRVLDWLDTPENASLMSIVDPYAYRDRLTMPKLVMNAANDQFFLPDSSKFYWDGLQGPKWLRYVPNAGHPLNDTALGSVTSFYYAIAADLPMPSYTFVFEDDGAILVRLVPYPDGSLPQPAAVTLWQAHNPKKRDFRGVTATYAPSAVAPLEPGLYRANVQPPGAGWIAYFVELSFPGPLPEAPYTFTTGVRTMPDAEPFTYKPPANPPKGFLAPEGPR